MKNKILHIRVSEADLKQLKIAAKAEGFKTVSDYIRHRVGLPVKIPKRILNPALKNKS